jgi:hypothetical protein
MFLQEYKAYHKNKKKNAGSLLRPAFFFFSVFLSSVLFSPYFLSPVFFQAIFISKYIGSGAARV